MARLKSTRKMVGSPSKLIQEVAEIKSLLRTAAQGNEPVLHLADYKVFIPMERKHVTDQIQNLEREMEVV